MSAYLETINRLAEEYKANVRAVEDQQKRIAEYEAKAAELADTYPCKVLVSVHNGRIAIWLSGNGKNVPGVKTRAFIGPYPIYDLDGFDVV